MIMTDDQNAAAPEETSEESTGAEESTEAGEAEEEGEEGA